MTFLPIELNPDTEGAVLASNASALLKSTLASASLGSTQNGTSS